MNMQAWCATPFITELLARQADKENTHPDRFHYYLGILLRYFNEKPERWKFAPDMGYQQPINAFIWDDAEEILGLHVGYFYSIHQWLEYGQVPKDWDGEKWIDSEMP